MKLSCCSEAFSSQLGLCFATNLSADPIHKAVWMDNLGDVDFRTSLTVISLYDLVNCLIPGVCFINKIWITATASVKAALETCDGNHCM